jgi:hypothetical protein
MHFIIVPGNKTQVKVHNSPEKQTDLLEACMSNNRQHNFNIDVLQRNAHKHQPRWAPVTLAYDIALSLFSGT